MASWKESMINRLSNLINRNRSAAKLSQVLCSSANPSDVDGGNGEACKNLIIRINWYQAHDICNIVCLFSAEEEYFQYLRRSSFSLFSGGEASTPAVLLSLSIGIGLVHRRLLNLLSSSSVSMQYYHQQQQHSSNMPQ